ncbi:MAG TPA: hypothetical protein VIM98_12570 [Dyella sp.]|uniref:hypothetical protein n=1 Tax=Dyella sp. TaxID=1869338 RepID=UPI002F92807C
MHSRAFLYTPFGGSHALMAAAGENMPRIGKGKPPHQLLAPNVETANEMERMRHMQVLGFQNVIGGHKELKRQLGQSYTTPEQLAKAKQTSAYLISKAHARLAKSMLPAYQQTRIANATVHFHTEDPRYPELTTTSHPNLYPSLHDGKPLANIGHKDKLYVLGHGEVPTPGRPVPHMHASPEGHGPSLSPGELADHLKQAGLPPDFKDLRIASCFGVSTKHGQPGETEANAKYFVPRLHHALQGDFPSLDVTGYKRGGVTTPFGAHHERSDEGSMEGRTRRKTEAVRFPHL